jgi:hypothetical protein
MVSVDRYKVLDIAVKYVVLNLLSSAELKFKKNVLLSKITHIWQQNKEKNL